MIAITNRLPVKEGAAEKVVERFAGNRGYVQDFPGFVSMEVLRSEDGSEVLVVTRWRDRASFDAWVGSDEFKRAHSQGDGEQLLRAHPEMGAYEVAVEREPGG